MFDAPEVWHEPTGNGEIRYITVPAGEGFLHPITTAEARQRIAELPSCFTRDIEVVQLSPMTRKRGIFPCYGMQWGPSVYLYPIEEALTEYFVQPPPPQLQIETTMYGGQWSKRKGMWLLKWSSDSIRDYYLHNILIHEIGHLNDHRNTSYRDRERYANWFAIEYGYRPWQRRPNMVPRAA